MSAKPRGVSGYDKGYAQHGRRMQASPDSIDGQLAEARILFARDQVMRAEAALRELVVRAPGRVDVATFLAEVLRSQGRLSAAAEAMSALAEAADFDAGVAVRAASFARECDRHVIAASICDGALARGQAVPELLVLAGHVAREAGEFVVARERYCAALAAGVDLDRQNVLGALSNTKRYTDPLDPDRARCEERFRNALLSPQSRASAGYALAKILNDLGDWAGAAAILREANALGKATRWWDPRTWTQFVAMRLRERIAAAAAADDPSFAPVFIVGVPRSGTTLAATHLARATGARDRGELRALRFIAERLRSGGHLGNMAAVMEAADLYRMMARQDDAPPAPAYIDQDPLNFRWLDIVAAMFPQAKVIHLRRDPCDVALSLWSQEFAHPDMAFSQDFGDIAGFMRGYDELMTHWKRSLRIPIRELEYEALVADPDHAIAELAAFVDLPLASSNSEGAAPVQSASVWQARQPVYKTSIGRWRHYAPYVPELMRFGDMDRSP